MAEGQNSRVSFKDLAIYASQDSERETNKDEKPLSFEEKKNHDNENNKAKTLPTNPIDFSQNTFSLDCPYCNVKTTTKIIKKPSKALYLSSILMCLCLPPTCFIPFLISRCYDKTHYCSNCGGKLGCHKSFSNQA